MKAEQVTPVSAEHVMDRVQALLREGMGLAKCRKCGCMKDALDNISASIRSPRVGASLVIRRATRLVPGLKAGIVPNANHCAQYTAPEIVNNRILEFLGEQRIPG